MRLPAFLFLIFTCLSASAIEPASPAAPVPWNIRDHQPLAVFLVQAHRGAGDLAEENTLEAFQTAWKYSLVPEADIRTTSDGVLVPFHDANFKRLVKDAPPELQSRGIEQLTFAEVAALDVGSWKGPAFSGRHVPRMSDVFAVMAGNPTRMLYLDIKNVDLPQLAAEVKAHHVEKQVILAATKYELHRAWRKLLPDSQTLLWMGGTEEALGARFAELRATGFADLTQVQVHVHLPDGATTIEPQAVNPFKESDAFLRACGDELRQHHILYQNLPWGAQGPEVYAKLLDLGSMSFATDHPEATWAAITEYYSAR